MFNILDALKNKNGMLNIFNSPTSPDPSVVDPNAMGTTDFNTQDAGGDNDLIARIQQMFQPQTDAQNQLRDLMAQQPSRADNAPGFWRKLAAGVVTGGDPDAAEKWANKGYYQKNDEWQKKLKPISELADSERANNTNMRMFGTQMANSEIRQRDLDRKVDKDKSDADLKQKTIDQRDRHLAYLTYKQLHPNHVYKTDKEGKVYSVDPQTNETNYLTDADGNFIESDKLPELDKLELQNKNTLGQIAARGTESRKNIGAQGAESRNTEEVRESNREDLEKIKETNRRTRPPGTTGAGRQDLPSVTQFMKAREIFNKNPELAPYISIDHGKKTFEITMPRNGNPALRKKAADAIYGSSASDMKSGSSVRKEIPGHPGKFATSSDGGKTWKAE